jgi:hypothetical protein
MGVSAQRQPNIAHQPFQFPIKKMHMCLME